MRDSVAAADPLWKKALGHQLHETLVRLPSRRVIRLPNSLWHLVDELARKETQFSFASPRDSFVHRLFFMRLMAAPVVLLLTCKVLVWSEAMPAEGERVKILTTSLSICPKSLLCRNSNVARNLSVRNGSSLGLRCKGPNSIAGIREMTVLLHHTAPRMSLG